MPAASILIKSVSSACNMRCRYCFYHTLAENRQTKDYGRMSEETLSALVREVITYADDYAAFAFQGGEPMLAGLSFYQKVVSLQKEYCGKPMVIENTIQTNGLLIDEAWAAFFAEHHFLVGLSLDGPHELHDRYRRTVDGEPTYTRVKEAADHLGRHGVEYNILTVITEQTAHHAKLLYDFYKENGFRYVQLIPCMDEASRYQESAALPFAVTPEHYGTFLCEFFDLWYEDFKNGDLMNVRLFSNLAQMAVGYPAEQCGMNGCCQCYFAVESSGSVYPCDFYCTDEWKLGEISSGFHTLLQTKKARRFVEVSAPIASECKDCPYLYLCRGGCRRWREPFVSGKPGLNRLCAAYRMFFEHTEKRIRKLGRTIVQPGYRLDEL